VSSKGLETSILDDYVVEFDITTTKPLALEGHWYSYFAIVPPFNYTPIS